MGNRACVVFFDDRLVSPTVYLHWCGNQVPAWLEELKELMQERKQDAWYAAARFVGICHSKIPGNLSLGVSSNRLSLEQVRNKSDIRPLSPGDAGLVVVDTRDFTWEAHGGYLALQQGRR